MTQKTAISNLPGLEALSPQEAITLDQAVTLFEELADIETIAFGYIIGGCYARAHLMCKAILEKNITPKKAWMFQPDFNSNLFVHCADGREAEWWWHVAPVVLVETPAGAQEMVFDPGVFDGPVTVAEWALAAKASPAQTKVVPLGVVPKKGFGDYCCYGENTTPETDKHAQKVMEQNCREQQSRPGLRSLFATKSRKEAYALRKQAAPRNGKTWRTDGDANTHYVLSRGSKTGWWSAKYKTKNL